jgi:hypothetical protein
MTTTLSISRRSARHALLTILGATLLAACGGGDHDAEEPGAAATAAQRDPGTAPAISIEQTSAHASRASMGGRRVAPICTHAPPECQPNVPPTQ